MQCMKTKKAFGFKNMSVQEKYNVMRTAAAIGIGLLVALVLILLTAKKPADAVKYFLLSPFLSLSYFSSMVERMIPLLFTGTAVCIMFSANQFNLGLEGSFYLGGFVATLSGLYILPNIPFLSPLVAILLGGITGAIITAIPALLQYKWNANVMVSSLMMNYICLYIGLFLLYAYFKDPASSQHTYPLSDASRISFIIPGTKIHWGIVIAAVLVFLAWLFLYRTRWGFMFRVMGQNPTFARYSGMGVAGIAIISQLIGGFIGGIGGATQMLGLYERFNWTALTGFGWDGVTVAIFAKNNPKNLPIAVLFIAYLRTGAYIMSYKAGVQSDIVYVVEGIMVLFLLAEQFLFKTYKKMVFKDADRKRKLDEAQSKAAAEVK